LERLQAARTQAQVVFDFHVREIRRLEADLAVQRANLQQADLNLQALDAKVKEETAPRLPLLLEAV